MCVCLQVPNQCLPGMLTEPQTATGNHDSVLSFDFKFDLLTLLHCLQTTSKRVWVCCERACLWRPADVYVCVAGLIHFLLLLRGQRSAQCQGRVTSWQMWTSGCSHSSTPADTGPDSMDTGSHTIISCGIKMEANLAHILYYFNLKLFNCVTTYL